MSMDERTLWQRIAGIRRNDFDAVVEVAREARRAGLYTPDVAQTLASLLDDNDDADRALEASAQ